MKKTKIALLMLFTTFMTSWLISIRYAQSEDPESTMETTIETSAELPPNELLPLSDHKPGSST